MSLLACVAVLLLPPPRDVEGKRGPWRVLLRLVLPLFTATVDVAVYLPLFSLARAVGP